MRNKVYPSAQAAMVGAAKDEMLIVCGGFGLCGMPEGLIDALAQTGVRGLTAVSNNAGLDGVGLARLIEQGQIAKMISSYVGNNKTFERAYLNGEIELEFSPQGTLAERLRAGGAGIPAFYTRTGVGTVIAEGKPHAEFEGTTYVQERGIRADLALIRAEIADEEGNLVFRKTARNFNPMMASCAITTIVEVEEIVPPGSIDPDHIHTPGIYIDRIVRAEVAKRIEFVTNRERGEA